MLIGVVAALCASGSLVGYVEYDKATKPDRTTPELAVRQYAQAYLGQHNDAQAATYACQDQSGLNEVKALRQDLDNREKTYNFTIYVNFDSVREVSRSGNTAHVAVVIVLFTNDSGQQLRRQEHWDFTAVRDNGWRTCAAHQVS
ncbi:hypothetical protein [Rugosimonospora acidiphila]|uniref:hypothetical protein n=1 Tax=Rugosimonospora acidiphila TaxID=556531 RepID=UPI0031F12571